MRTPIAGELQELIEMIEDKLIDQEITFSAGDLLRLLHARHEAMGVVQGDVTMQWVTECEESPEEE